MAVRAIVAREEEKRKLRQTLEQKRLVTSRQFGGNIQSVKGKGTAVIPERKVLPYSKRGTDDLSLKKQMEVASTVTHEEEKRKLRQTLEQKRYNITRQHIQSVQEKDTAIPERKVPPRRPPYRATDVLATKKQVVYASLSWKPCSNLPIKLSEGNTTVLDDRVYCGGGTTDREDNEYIVYCYDPSQDNWITLPPLSVKYFGLGQVLGKLVSVGGKKKIDDRATDGIYSFDERVQRWKQTVPPMPSARFAASVLSLKSNLVVAGGRNTSSSFTNAVEIFNHGTLQWYKTYPLPVACSSISLGITNGTCYALGGYKYLSRLNQALYVSVDDLLHHAVPASQAFHSHSKNEHPTSAWKEYPSIPSNQPAAAVLAGSILTMGGKKVPSGANAKEVYMYVPAINSWIYFSDLPAPQFGSMVAVLSSTEILLIGGYHDENRLNIVYKGTLYFKV